MKTSVLDKIARNVVFNFSAAVWGGVIGFFLTPYIVGHLGRERYGMLALVGTIVGYASLFDISMDSTFAKFISEYHAKDDTSSVNRVLSAGMAFYSVLGAALIVCAALYCEPLLRFLNVPPKLHDEGRFAVIFGAFLFALSSVGGIFEALVYGLQRLDLINQLNMANAVHNALGTVLVLREGWGIRGLLWLRALVRVVSVAGNRAFAKRLLPELKPSWRSIDSEMLGRLARFGVKLHVCHIAGVVTAETDKLLITTMLSIGLVADFQVGSSLVVYGMALAGMLSVNFIPAFSELAASGDHDLVVAAYVKGSRSMCALTAPIFVFIIASSGELMRLWMGPGFENAAFLTKILAVGFFTEAVAAAGASVCVATTRPGILARKAVVVACADVVLNFVLIRSFRFAGAGWGTSAALALGNLYLHGRLQRDLGVAPGILRRSLAPLIAVATASALAVSPLDGLLDWPALNRPELALFIAAKGLAFCAFYALGTKVLGVFSPEETALFKSKLNLLLGR